MSYKLTQTEIVTIAAKVFAETLAEALATRMAPEPVAEGTAELVTVPARAKVAAEPNATKAERALLPALDGFTYKHLTIEPLSVDPALLDTQTGGKERSPYNKLRFHLEKSTPLAPETTHRQLAAEHARLAEVVKAKADAPEAPKARKVTPPAGKGAGKGAGKAGKAKTVAAIDADDRAMRIQDLVDLGFSREAAEAVVNLA